MPYQMMPQGMPQEDPGGLPQGGGSEYDPTPEDAGMYSQATGEDMLSGDQISQQIQQMVSQMPPEAIDKILQMDETEAIKFIMNEPNPETGQSLVEDVGDPGLALDLAGLFYEEIAKFAQVSQNKTLGMINPNMMKDPRQGGGEQQAPMQGPPPVGGDLFPPQGGM